MPKPQQRMLLCCCRYSDKPRSPQPNALYNFPNWAVQLQDFIVEKVGEPAFITCNSGGWVIVAQTVPTVLGQEL